jgi:hypothetical protein
MIRVFIPKGYNGMDSFGWERKLNVGFGWAHLLESCKSEHKQYIILGRILRISLWQWKSDGTGSGSCRI